MSAVIGADDETRNDKSAQLSITLSACSSDDDDDEEEDEDDGGACPLPPAVLPHFDALMPVATLHAECGCGGGGGGGVHERPW